MVRMTGRLPVKEDDGMSPAQRPVSTHHTTHSGVRPHKECAAEKVREHSGVLSEVPGVPSAIHLWGAVPQDQSPQWVQYELRQV